MDGWLSQWVRRDRRNGVWANYTIVKVEDLCSRSVESRVTIHPPTHSLAGPQPIQLQRIDLTERRCGHTADD